MGFWSPRAICPGCGGKIHTRTGLFRQVSGKQCQHCGVPLTGKVGVLTNMAVIDESRLPNEQKQRQPTATPSQPGGSATRVKTSRADELEKLARLKERGVITEDEFETEKKRVLDGA
jgi:hypothetical protein